MVRTISFQHLRESILDLIGKQKANPDVTIKSSLLTQYNVATSEKETDEDFRCQFDKPITITEAFKGTWIFHLLGLYKYKGKRAAYYLDPEFTGGS